MLFNLGLLLLHLAFICFQAFTTIAIFSSMRLSIGALALPMKAIAEVRLLWI